MKPELIRMFFSGALTLAFVASMTAGARADVVVTQSGETLKINGGAANEFVFIDGKGAIGEVVVRVDAGPPLDFVGVRNVQVALGAGDDTIEVSALQIGGSLVAKMGTGNDQVFINDDGIVENAVVIGRDVDVALGGQSGDLCKIATSGDGPIIVGRNLSVRGAADLSIEGEGGNSGSDVLDVYVGGDVRIQSPVAAFVDSDLQTLELQDVNVGGRMRIELGGFADAIKITRSHFASAVEFKLGGGDDILDFGDLASAFDATVRVDGGGGTDVLQHVTNLDLVSFPKLKKLEEVEAFP